MPSSVYFGGRNIVVPGAYSVIDASQLQSTSISSTGIVALVGTAEGGVPLTVDKTYDLSNPQKAQKQYRSGDLRTASLFAFDPSLDEAVPGGAQMIVPVKVNPATQSIATLADALAAPSVDLTSVDYGLFTSQINLSVAAGTDRGKLITITFEDVVETFDDVGGLPAFSALYTPSTGGYTTALARVTSTAFIVDATKTATGLVAQRTANIPAPGALRYVSSNAGDTTQSVTVYGLSGTTPVSETKVLNGVTPVQGTQSFSKVLGTVMSAAAVGTVLVTDSVIPTTLFSLAPAVLTRGVVLLTNSPVADTTIAVSIDVNAANDVAVFGLSTTGAIIGDRFDMTAGTTPVVSADNFRTLSVLCLGDIAGARTITVAARAVSAATATFKTVQRLVDRLNALAGFTATALAVDAGTELVSTLDYSTAVSLLTTATFSDDLERFIEALNNGSAMVRAARHAGASLVPANTASDVYLSGGIEGVVTINQWQAALDLLKKRRVTQIVVLSRDPAIEALLRTHLVWRAGQGRSEANGYVAFGKVDGTGETQANIRTQLQALNTRHLSGVAQECQRFDPLTGEATWYPPYMFDAIAAGQQAGAPVGEPLTHKLINVLDIRNDSTWDVENDQDSLIRAGLMIAEKVDGIGIRWIRSITTYTQDDNVVFGEVSANAADDTAIFEFRRRMERKVGTAGIRGSVGVLKSLALGVLEELVLDGILFSYRPETLVIEQIGDAFPVSVEWAPVTPISFILVTAHLFIARAAA
jgi:hypothetical protein